MTNSRKASARERPIALGARPSRPQLVRSGNALDVVCVSTCLPSAAAWKAAPGVSTFLEGAAPVTICIWPGIPTGFCPKARGCEGRATLGKPSAPCPTPTGLRLDPQPVELRTLPRQHQTDWDERWLEDALELLDPIGVDNRAAKEDDVNVKEREPLWQRFPFLFGRNPVGVVVLSDHLPRVARSSQPWALGRNPFGILGGIVQTPAAAWKAASRSKVSPWC